METVRSSNPDADRSALQRAEASVERAENANSAVVEAMIALPARTLGGLAFKARVSSEYEDHSMPELVASIMDDILAMDVERLS